MEATVTPEPVRNYTAALVQSAAQIGQIIDQMTQFARKRPHPRSKPTVVILTELIEGIITDHAGRLHPADLKRASEILILVTDAIGEDLFFVDPDELDGQGTPGLN